VASASTWSDHESANESENETASEHENARESENESADHENASEGAYESECGRES
jgi:phosphodiesterase/alkaline phosphatase D-like protein